MKNKYDYVTVMGVDIGINKDDEVWVDNIRSEYPAYELLWQVRERLLKIVEGIESIYDDAWDEYHRMQEVPQFYRDDDDPEYNEEMEKYEKELRDTIRKSVNYHIDIDE